VLSVLYSYMEDWRWRMDLLLAIGVEKPDTLEQAFKPKPRPVLAAPGPAGRTAYNERRARILAAGGEIGV
jgi:hypothetical protein